MQAGKKVLIVGQGSIGKRHERVVDQCVSVARVKSIGQREFDHATEGMGSAEREDYIIKLNDGKPDFVIVAGPASTHMRTARTFAEMSLPMLIEKPLSNNCSGVQALIDTILEKKLCVSVGYNLRFVASLQRFRQVINCGEFGKVVSVRCEVGHYLPDWRPGIDYTRSVSANASLGGGVLLELSHELDYLQWIFGPIVKVSGLLSNSGTLNIDVEDTAHLLLKFSENETFTGAADNHFLASVNMDFLRRDPVRQCIVITENATIRWDGIADEVTFFSPELGKWNLVYKGDMSRNESYKRALDTFVECLEKGSTPEVSAIDGKSVLDVIEAIRLSSAAQKFVDVGR